MTEPKLRWGILGAANIARKNWKAIRNSENGRIVAVASRDRERSRRFIEECQTEVAFDPVPRALGSYEEVLSAPDVDAVYIPLPTAIRGSWVKRAAEAGKHVVCEKPCAANLGELTEMLEACRRNSVQFMDGVMFMHSRRLERIREILNDRCTIGDIRRITSDFSFVAPEEFFQTNIRARSELEPFGCLGDLGWYCIRFALWVMNWKLPERVVGRILQCYQHPGSQMAVPTEFSAELFFGGHVSASFYCSFMTETEQWAIVSGTRGHLRVPDFVLPFSAPQVGFETGKPVFAVRGCDFEMQPHTRRWEVQESSHSDITAQESRMFRQFTEQVQSGTLNEVWPQMALSTQQVMQACCESSRIDARPVSLVSRKA